MKKWIWILLMALALVACGPKAESKVSEETQKETEEKGQALVSLIHEGKKDEFKNHLSADMDKVLTDEQWEAILKDIHAKGEFVEFKKAKVQKVEDKGQEFIVLLQQAAYKEGDLLYTLSFDKDGKLAGIYYK